MRLRRSGFPFERAPGESRTASAGWYNNRAFETRARARGLYAKTLDGDAFSDELKQQVIDTVAADLGEIDLLVYSLASPVRKHPRTGELHRSVIKPLGDAFHVKTLNVAKGVVGTVDLAPADEAETAATVAVMGGEDWEFWIDALKGAGLLADGFRTLSYTYIGSELTWPIYWHATLGKAKEDLDRAAQAINRQLGDIGGRAQVAVLRAVVTQASAANPGRAAVHRVAVRGHEKARESRSLHRPHLPALRCRAVRRVADDRRGGPLAA